MYPNCKPRKPRGWHDKRLLPSVCFEDDGKLFEALAEDKPLGTIEVVGSKELRTGVKHEYLEVTLLDGTIVPAYRRVEGDAVFCVCQNFAYKAARA